MTMDLTGFEATAASEIVRVIDAALTAWERTETGPGMWVWRYQDEDNDRGQVVVVNALPDRVLVPTAVWPAKVGPTVLAGVEGDAFASVTLPNVSDGSDLRKALRIIALLVPDLDPAPASGGVVEPSGPLTAEEAEVARDRPGRCRGLPSAASGVPAHCGERLPHEPHQFGEAPVLRHLARPAPSRQHDPGALMEEPDLYRPHAALNDRGHLRGCGCEDCERDGEQSEGDGRG